MINYIVGYDLYGYNKIDITDSQLNAQDIHCVVVIDKDCDNRLPDYYNSLKNMLKLRHNIILIGIDDGNKIFNTLAYLMASYGEYNIYTVVSKDIITQNYIKTLKNRKPNFMEIQTYLSGEIMAYSDIDAIMIGLENIVQDGNVELVKPFLNKYVNSVESFVNTISYMKTICEQFNSEELVNKVSKLDALITKHKSNIDNLNKEMQQLETENKQIKKELIDAKKDLTKTKEDNDRLKEEYKDGASIITAFQTVNTQSKNCKVKNIIYFKEISYVPYTNSLVITLLDTIKKRLNKNVKLVIYDNKSEFLKVYDTLQIANGNRYLSNKENLLKKVDRFVVSEPVQNIIEDLISLDNLDVLIIYDRMKTARDVISGNNVVKYAVVNSSTDYTAFIKMVKTFPEDRVITRFDSEFVDYAIKIPVIKDYKGGSVFAKITKFVRIDMPDGNTKVIDHIIEKSRIVR